MKILFVTPSFYPNIGGVEEHALRVAEELARQGNEVNVLTQLSPKNQHNKKNNYQSIGKSDTYDIKLKKAAKSIQTDHFEPEQIKISRLNFGKDDWFKKFRIWQQMLISLKFFREADIIHCHDVFFWCLPLRFIFPYKKFYTTFHGYETKFPPATGARIVRKISEVLSNGNICIGQYIEKWYGTKADYVSYGGVNKNSKLKTQSSKLNNRIKILLVGRLEGDNGVDIYLNTLGLLKKEGERFDFVVCGDGELRKNAERFGKVLGFVKPVSDYIARADIVFASSYLSILEAMAAGVPVFAVYKNSLKEDYLKDTPFANMISISASSQELFSSIKNSNSKSKVKVAQDWARKQTWGSVANTYKKLWRV